MQNDHRRILIIEDEEDYRFYFSSVLSGAGYLLKTVTAEKLIETVKQHLG